MADINPLQPLVKIGKGKIKSNINIKNWTRNN